MPRDGGLAVSLTEKLEDMVSIIFLPLVSLSGFEVDACADDFQYFSLSGLSTDLGLLNSGKH